MYVCGVYVSPVYCEVVGAEPSVSSVQDGSGVRRSSAAAGTSIDTYTIMIGGRQALLLASGTLPRRLPFLLIKEVGGGF